MARILVLGGAGEMGSTSVRDLAERTEHEIVVGDLDLDAALGVAGSLPRAAEALAADVADDRSLRSALEGVDVVLNTTFMRWVPRVTEAAVRAGVHLADLGAYWPETEQQLALDADARAAGCRIVAGCGVAPGLSNVLTRMGAGHLDRLDAVRYRSYISHPLSTSPGIVHTRFDTAVIDSLVLRGGELVSVPSLGEEEEEVDFPAPYGKRSVHLVPHPEPLTVSRYFPGVRDVDFKVGYPDEDWVRLRTLLEYGFADERPFAFGGSRVVPRDFAAAFVGRIGAVGQRTANVKRVILDGERQGHATRVIYDFAVEDVGRTASAAITGTMGAIGAAILADGGGEPGVHPPEGTLDPRVVLAALRERGFEVTESVSAV